MYDDLEEEIDFLDEDLDDDFYGDSELFDVDESYDDDSDDYDYDDDEDDFNAYYEFDSLDDEIFEDDEGDSLSRRQRRARRRSRRRRILGRAKRLALKLAKKAKANAGKIGMAIGGAIGGPAGASQGAQIGNAIQNLEDDEDEWEDESDTEDEMNAVMPMSTLDDSLAEAMASAAAKSKPSDAQALGGAIAITITSRAPMAVKNIAPAMACATGRVAKQMAADPPSRPLINVLPTIVKDTAATLTKKAEKGKPITKRTVARVMTKQAKRTLRSHTKLAQALTNNVLKKQKLKKTAVARAERFY